jgi:hypothetical protein
MTALCSSLSSSSIAPLTAALAARATTSCERSRLSAHRHLASAASAWRRHRAAVASASRRAEPATTPAAFTCAVASAGALHAQTRHHGALTTAARSELSAQPS